MKNIKSYNSFLNERSLTLTPVPDSHNSYKFTKEEKEFINRKFTEHEFYGSKEKYLFLPMFDTKDLNPNDKNILKKLVNAGVIHYDRNNGFTVPYIPNFYINKK